jgi:uncharacterized protein (DUF58 family)
MPGAREVVHLSLALIVAGALFGLSTLYVPAIALGLLALGAVAWVGASARGARVHPVPGPPTIEEGKPYPLRLRVDWGRAPPPGGELNHSGLRGPVPVGPGSHPEVTAELRFTRWGPTEIDPATLAVHDPLHLHRRQVEGSPGPRVLVLPRVEPVLAPAEGAGPGTGLSSGRVGSRAGGRGGAPIEPEIDGLQPWHPGTPASRIHWASLARTGELLERSLTGGGDSSPLVVLDRSRGADPESLLSAVRAAASLCLHLARVGCCSLLLPGESQMLRIDRELRSWGQVHARLALVDPDRPLPAHPLSDTTTILWVSATGLAEPGGAGRNGGRRGYLVTPAEIRGANPVFHVAGCRGYEMDSATRGLAVGADRHQPAWRGGR